MSNTVSRRSLLIGGLALPGLMAMENAIAQGAKKTRKVLVWSEGTAPKNVYPNDINAAIAEGLKPLKGWEVQAVSINDPDQGLPDDLLNSASALIWWGHQRHGDVKDELVAKIKTRVTEEGMGFIATHSAHYSKALKAILGTPCGWSYYTDDGAKLDMVVKAPTHPICKGVKDFTIPHTERYGDPFQCPTPETVLFDGIYTMKDDKTEHCLQGFTWTIGKGRVMYFQPGHEGYPIYFMPEVQQIFRNGVQWVASKK